MAERVAAAERIVVFVHGILGDTRGMTASAFAAPLAGTHDLVLAFDYENLKTPVEETARALGQRLAAAGLVPGHGKTLHLVAHSMGGLVSRWFIEREGGAAVVSRLVTLGTPNGGSPWPVVQKWATIAVGLGVNALATVAWPISAFSGLLGLIEKIDVTLDQMEPGSTLLGGLAASAAPGVDYTLLAGNTSIIDGDERVTKLLVKLRQEVAGKAFFGEHNDIAVTVASASGVPAGWVPAPVVDEVACDHLTYFTVPASLRAARRRAGVSDAQALYDGGPLRRGAAARAGRGGDTLEGLVLRRQAPARARALRRGRGRVGADRRRPERSRAGRRRRSSNLALELKYAGRLQEALPINALAVERMRAVPDGDPRALATLVNNLGETQRALGPLRGRRALQRRGARAAAGVSTASSIRTTRARSPRGRCCARARAATPRPRRCSSRR